MLGQVHSNGVPLSPGLYLIQSPESENPWSAARNEDARTALDLDLVAIFQMSLGSSDDRGLPDLQKQQRLES